MRPAAAAAKWRRSARAGALFAFWAGLAVTVAGLSGCATTASTSAPTTAESTTSVDPTFMCGNTGLRCQRGTQYCETLKTDTPLIPSDFACKPLPAACQTSEGPAGQAACSCFPPGTRGHFCSAVDAPGGRAFYRTQIGGH